MTASLFVTSTPALRVGSGARAHDGPRDVPAVSHAVSKPAVDGLEVSVCGVLVTAIAAEDWSAGRTDPRCPECSRIAD